jgi:uncharacterized protein YhdP
MFWMSVTVVPPVRAVFTVAAAVVGTPVGLTTCAAPEAP